MSAASLLRVALVGPRETPYGNDPNREHREEMRRSYAEICRDAVALGSDYTLSREFLGIEYLASTLRHAGRLVCIFSAADESIDDVELVRRLSDFAPAIAGFSLLYDLQLPSALTAAAELKRIRPGTFVVFGGPLASAISGLLLESFPFIDAVIEGEGETAIARLAEVIEAGGDLAAVPSLVRRQDGTFVRGPRAAPVDLDSLPHPSRDIIAGLRDRGLPVPSAYLTTSRGCKAFCTFCTVPNVVRGMGEATYRMRDPRDVVDEMEACVRDLGVTRFYMADDNFLGYGEASNRRMIAFADEILRRGLEIRFHAECRVDSLVPETLLRLRQAGFDQILFGLESGSAKTLKRWAKGQTVADNKAAMALARQLRLDVMPSIILLDWESGLDEVEETVGFIERTQLWRSSQPLWLVNKLKVHCGTAAARRHDKVRGKPVLPPLDPGDAESRARWCAAATYQKTPIDNPHVAAFWSALNGEANRWSVLVDEILPPLLKSLRVDARHDDGAALDRIRRIAAYRRSIGGALAELMRALVDAAADRQASARPPTALDAIARRSVAAFEERHFPGGIDTWLAPVRERPVLALPPRPARRPAEGLGGRPVPAISVVIPTSGKPERLILALHSLIPQSVGTDRFETIVVADGPAAGTDEAVAAAREAGLPVRLLRTPQVGQAATRNHGAAAARAPHLLFMDDDVLLSPDYLAETLALLGAGQRRIVRAPVYVLRYLAALRDPERGIRHDGGALPSGSALATRLVTRAMVRCDWPGIARQCVHRNRFERLVSRTLAEGPANETWLGYSGSGVALGRELFEDAGGYDPGFGLRWGAEAIELGYRLMKRGATFVEARGIKSAHMDHPRGAAMASFSESFDYFFAKHRDPAIRRVEAKILGVDRRPGAMASVTEQA